MAPPQNLHKNLQPEDVKHVLQQVNRILGTFYDPQSNIVLPDSGCIEGLIFKEGKLSFALKAHASKIPDYESLSKRLTAALKEIPLIKDVLIVLTAHRPEASASKNKHLEKLEFPNIQKIIAVASGKGGVGKSTIAVNLALQLKEAGLKVGLMDADLYGPSIPRMLGLSGQPELTADKKMIPLEYQGLKCISIGFMISEETPVIWRGPIIQSSFQQLINGTDWGHLDVLVIDLPPGTGDTHLTLVQKIPLSGVVIVSTPQDIALIDARRAIAMFQKMHTPIIGIVENMSTFICPHCNHETSIFSHGGARQEFW